jgi:hypothetical protein
VRTERVPRALGAPRVRRLDRARQLVKPLSRSQIDPGDGADIQAVVRAHVLVQVRVGASDAPAQACPHEAQ